MGPLSSVSMTWEDFDCFQAVEALTNVHIDFEAVSFESYMTQFNIYVAAGDYADLITSVGSKYVGGAQSAFEDGVIVDIEPYLREYARITTRCSKTIRCWLRAPIPRMTSS